MIMIPMKTWRIKIEKINRKRSKKTKTKINSSKNQNIMELNFYGLLYKMNH